MSSFGWGLLPTPKPVLGGGSVGARGEKGFPDLDPGGGTVTRTGSSRSSAQFASSSEPERPRTLDQPAREISAAPHLKPPASKRARAACWTTPTFTAFPSCL